VTKKEFINQHQSLTAALQTKTGFADAHPRQQHKNGSRHAHQECTSTPSSSAPTTHSAPFPIIFKSLSNLCNSHSCQEHTLYQIPPSTAHPCVHLPDPLQVRTSLSFLSVQNLQGHLTCSLTDPSVHKPLDVSFSLARVTSLSLRQYRRHHGNLYVRGQVVK